MRSKASPPIYARLAVCRRSRSASIGKGCRPFWSSSGSTKAHHGCSSLGRGTSMRFCAQCARTNNPASLQLSWQRFAPSFFPLFHARDHVDTFIPERLTFPKRLKLTPELRACGDLEMQWRDRRSPYSCRTATGSIFGAIGSGRETRECESSRSSRLCRNGSICERRQSRYGRPPRFDRKTRRPHGTAHGSVRRFSQPPRSRTKTKIVIGSVLDQTMHQLQIGKVSPPLTVSSICSRRSSAGFRRRTDSSQRTS